MRNLFQMFGYWRKRALAAEATIAQLQGVLDEAAETNKDILARIEDRAALISIATTGRTKRLMFIRNGELTTIDVYATMDIDWKAIEERLLRNG